MIEYIKLEECIDHGLYRLASRNLTMGVFDEKSGGFVGIRFKFECEFLETEYHGDTAFPKEYLGQCPIADLRESVGSVDANTNREVEYDIVRRGWYYKDTKERDSKIVPISIQNKALFDWLKMKSKRSD